MFIKETPCLSYHGACDQQSIVVNLSAIESIGYSMPLIDIHVMEAVFSDEEKAQIISETAKAFGKVTGKALQDMTTVRVHEVKSGHWGGADNLWTTQRALELKRGE
ncbi:tautomerase family protein [uncultured Ruegeria sp.]|uniref:tautomerase family protein n=1 Tax=uncultured Ruegeria sp. TaxID=259304 RepID=UPI00260A59BA|nr:tautomerase family protein [uncultured Ruegeria sp.]